MGNIAEGCISPYRAPSSTKGTRWTSGLPSRLFEKFKCQPALAIRSKERDAIGLETFAAGDDLDAHPLTRVEPADAAAA